MTICPKCARSLELLSEQSPPATCPHCHARLRGTASSEWADVARVTNLAEAGFLSDELHGLDIEARVYQCDDFSEMRGGWSTTYLIRVPAGAAQQAASHIRTYAADAAAEDELAAREVRFTREAGPIDPAYWRPVAVVVLAGVASFVLGRQTALPEAHRRLHSDSLATAVDQVGQPFYTEASPGRPRYRLSLDKPNRVWNLDLDFNGDGVYDTRRQLESSAAVW